jgi:ABC-type uncharacterized transport system auxiliary subunit
VRLALALALATALLCAGCLTPKLPTEPRYFSPRVADPAGDAPAPRQDGPLLHLRRVRAAAYLRARMVWRRGVELGFYDLWRWTEPPSRFAQSSLDDELFERRGFQRTTLASAPTVDATLESFDEVLEPKHEAVVSLDVHVLDDKRATVLDRTFEASRPITGDDPEAIADALGDALTAVTREVGEAVTKALGAR